MASSTPSIGAITPEGLTGARAEAWVALLHQGVDCFLLDRVTLQEGQSSGLPLGLGLLVTADLPLLLQLLFDRMGEAFAEVEPEGS